MWWKLTRHASSTVCGSSGSYQSSVSGDIESEGRSVVVLCKMNISVSFFATLQQSLQALQIPRLLRGQYSARKLTQNWRKEKISRCMNLGMHLSHSVFARQSLSNILLVSRH